MLVHVGIKSVSMLLCRSQMESFSYCHLDNPPAAAGGNSLVAKLPGLYSPKTFSGY